MAAVSKTPQKIVEEALERDPEQKEWRQACTEVQIMSQYTTVFSLCKYIKKEWSKRMI